MPFLTAADVMLLQGLDQPIAPNPEIMHGDDDR
jgi:hypothetical protein